jgi:hypothetical protein
MQSLVFLHCLGVWHGNPDQRVAAQEALSIFARFARRFGLLSPCGTERPDSYSPFHHMSPAVPITFESWNWLNWVEQEKRSRLVFLFYSFDSAQVLYCNREPHFNPQTILLPLPCDDAAWEAQTAQQCAEALGLAGNGIQANVNVSGTRRVRQLELNYTLSALQSPVVDFRPGTTNVMTKFILIHALLEQIWLAQRQLHRDKMDRTADAEGDSFTADSIYNPLSRDSRHAEAGHGPSANDFDAVFNLVPPLFTADSSLSKTSAANVILQSARHALAKWKRMWDQDIILQYPPGSRRFGFCRDALSFFWLGLSLIGSERMDEWMLDPDTRFRQVIGILNKSKATAQVDVKTRGEALGSVADVDERYGVDDLTFEMNKLFRPME